MDDQRIAVILLKDSNGNFWVEEDEHHPGVYHLPRRVPATNADGHKDAVNDYLRIYGINYLFSAKIGPYSDTDDSYFIVTKVTRKHGSGKWISWEEFKERLLQKALSHLNEADRAHSLYQRWTCRY